MNFVQYFTCALFSASRFLTVLASVTSSTGSPRNISPLGTNFDEAHCRVIHQVFHWLPWGTLQSKLSTTGSAWGSKTSHLPLLRGCVQHITLKCGRRDVQMNRLLIDARTIRLPAVAVYLVFTLLPCGE